MKLSLKRFSAKFRKLFRDKRNIRFVFLIIGVVTFLVIFYSIWTRFQKTDQNGFDRWPRMSVFNEGSSGTMALKELYESLGWKVEKIMEPLVSFDEEQHQAFKRFSVLDSPGIILIIEPETAFSRKDVDMMERKAQEGYTIIVFSESGYKMEALLRKEKPKQKQVWRRSEVYKKVLTNITSLTRDKERLFKDVDELELKSGMRFDAIDSDWKKLAGDVFGTVIAEKNIGLGRLVAVSDSDFLSNYRLRKKDNAILAVMLVEHYLRNSRTTPVYFNEFYHGFHKKLTLLYFVAKKEYGMIVLQLFLFLLFLFYAKGVRFGQYHRPYEPDKNKIYFFSEGMAGLMSDRRYYNEVFRMVTENYRKLAMLHPHKTTRSVQKAVEELEEETKDKDKTWRDIRRLFELIKQGDQKIEEK